MEVEVSIGSCKMDCKMGRQKCLRDLLCFEPVVVLCQYDV